MELVIQHHIEERAIVDLVEHRPDRAVPLPERTEPGQVDARGEADVKDGSAGNGSPDAPVKTIHKIMAVLIVLAVIGVGLWHAIAR